MIGLTLEPTWIHSLTNSRSFCGGDEQIEHTALAPATDTVLVTNTFIKSPRNRRATP